MGESVGAEVGGIVLAFDPMKSGESDLEIGLLPGPGRPERSFLPLGSVVSHGGIMVFPGRGTCQ
jgi:hypothetical protein